MTRRLLIVTICLLLGAAANVAVAWGAIAWAPQELELETEWYVHQGGDWWLAFARDRFAAVDRIKWYCFTTTHPEVLADKQRSPPKWSRITTLTTFDQPDAPAGSLLDVGYESAAGWPARSLWCSLLWRFSRSSRLRPTEVHGILLPPKGQTGPYPPARVLPRHPIWPGFAVNTIFWAAIIFGLIRSPLALHRFIRWKRGLCSACAYPIGTSPVCTECGAPLPSTWRAALQEAVEIGLMVPGRGTRDTHPSAAPGPGSP